MKKLATLVWEQAVKAVVTVIVGVLLASIGVGVVKGDVKAAVQVPADLIRGVGTMEQAANKYLEAP